MDALPSSLAFLLLLFSGWVNRQQQAVIDYLLEGNRVLCSEHGCRLSRADKLNAAERLQRVRPMSWAECVNDFETPSARIYCRIPSVSRRAGPAGVVPA